jgi:alpha-ketoglutaric semialdehyde dehydrogenase
MPSQTSSVVQPVLIDGRFRASEASSNPASTFQPDNPTTREGTGEIYPVSPAPEVESAIKAGHRASLALREVSGEVIARFLETYAAKIEAGRAALVAMAHNESALPKQPRLDEIELPRTLNQLRLGAAAAREGSWALPTIDTKAGIRSVFGPLDGAVSVFGPNNFPFAFNSIAGGDFVAAIASGNAVIAKANTSHPGTTRLFAQHAQAAIQEVGLPPATVQLLYRTDHETGKLLVAHPLIGATGYTGARGAGLTLKAAADRAGKPIYLELSSINPVVFLPGALRTRGAALVEEFTASSLLGTGQFCTNPGLVVLFAGEETEAFVRGVRDKFAAAPVGTLLGKSVQDRLGHAVKVISGAGAQVVTGGHEGGGRGYCFSNTLLRADGATFLRNPAAMQEEAFGNAALFVVVRDEAEALAVLEALDGNLTGAIYSDVGGSDDGTYASLASTLRRKVGRLLNDKMPTGVAVSAAMNHGGPYPATGHPGFTAVGIPASLRRFAALHSYDNVREARLPASLRNKNPDGRLWRYIDGAFTQADVPTPPPTSA